MRKILSPNRANNIPEMINYVIQNNIEGDIIDIGVYEGFSAVTAICTLTKLNQLDRNVYLYDTFEGMPKPTEEDGEGIKNRYELLKNGEYPGEKGWVYCDIETVKRNVNSRTTYDKNKIFYIKGMVEDTLPNNTHNKIAYLRLDTDLYSSTKIELEYLYPKLQPGAVLIVDDYGSKFQGCAKAVDEYFIQHNINRLLINRFPNDCGFYLIKP